MREREREKNEDEKEREKRTHCWKILHLRIRLAMANSYAN